LAGEGGDNFIYCPKWKMRRFTLPFGGGERK
jgi:hypothetical protein